MKKLFLVFILFVGFTSLTVAQDYKIGPGVRLGITPGISVKYFLDETSVIEGMFTSRWHGAIITGLYEKQYRILEEFGLSAFFGGGGHIGRWEGYDMHPWYKDDKNHYAAGLDAIVGLEYFFKAMPMSVSLDWKPEFNFVKTEQLQIVEAAITFRWLLFSEK